VANLKDDPMNWMIAAILLMALPSAAVGADHIDRLRNNYSRAGFHWLANHESADFSEYFWRHADTACGWLMVVPDPTESGRGYVAESQIFCSVDQPAVHRLYPTLNLENCLYGGYYSSFDVWLSAPPARERGWISLATYTNAKNWQDLFGVNLGAEGGQPVLVLFHVPIFGQGRFKRETPIAFPMKQWVKIEVVVDAEKGIRVFQDGTLVLQADKDWGPAGPSICEAHWGLYAEGKTDFVHLLNDDIVLRSGGHPMGSSRPGSARGSGLP
jgi:hypothetical protein